LACRFGFRDILELLLKSNGNQSLKNIYKSTPLIIAIQNNKLNCIRVLKRYKVNFGECSPNKSPLHYAIKQKNEDIVKYVLQEMVGTVFLKIFIKCVQNKKI